MKLCMSQYSPESMPDAKLSLVASFSSFGDMTSQNVPRKKGTSHQIRLFTPYLPLFTPIYLTGRLSKLPDQYADFIILP